MKKIVLFALLFLTFGIFSQDAYACSCPTISSDEKDSKQITETIKNYYLKEFKGAIFTGKVLNVEEVELPNFFIPKKKKITIKVEKYWLGVPEPIITIYTARHDGACGVSFEKGERYFFIPEQDGDILEIGLCAYTRESKDADGMSVGKFNQIFGEAKTFEKKANQ